MDDQWLFVHELELPYTLMNSELLQTSWNPIPALYEQVNASAESLRCTIDEQERYKVIAFVTSPANCTTHHLLQGEKKLVSSEALKQHNFLHFDSLCSRGNPSFSIHEDAITLFASNFDTLFNELTTWLIGSATDDKQVIITGYSLGGSVAALFTLFLLVLDSINPKSKRLPLCITFGSPLIGDNGLLKAVSERSRWSSCFIHVVGSQDQVPSLFVPVPSLFVPVPDDQQKKYMPFGTFLFCSEVGFACVEDPESVLELLKCLKKTRSLASCHVNYYGSLVNFMANMFLVKMNSQLGLSNTNASPLRAGLILQLEATGITVTSEHEQYIESLTKKIMEKREKLGRETAKAMDRNRKLNETKIKMAYLEWYKKKNTNGIGYYDSYKRGGSTSDRDVTNIKKNLRNYWVPLVEKAEKKPEKETENIRDTWLFAGINYRRMVEPLDIAEYYGEGKTDYRNCGRSKHYKLLEQWQKEYVPKPARIDLIKKRKNVAGNLTEDSCFWADIEEALIRTRRFNDASFAERLSILGQLSVFEKNVMEQIRESAVSPEIFLEESTFMKWWNEYLNIIGPSHDSALTQFMKNGRYRLYADGVYWEDMQID